MGKFTRGVAAGAIIGATVGMMVMPQLDRRTKRSMRKAGMKMRNMAEDTYDGMMHWSK
ncbi:YtxH domain-containing protein [Clostridium uliginosum]|uniref:YtxH-like protein n=1 Tax=Clostridium uliginosum TaxID=119641 RepID=A0A1I1HVD7_9CLOT|nr:YtxH domain-containing protein [Clostridium uliginosum]SFC27532.1 hypothetical protein SAMN05421842_10210 [Clostridium uliginosum]